MNFFLMRDNGDIWPLLRLFFQNVLFELDASLDGDWLFNWNIEF